MAAEDSLTHPTYVIGVGQAGINVMNTLHEVAEENGDLHKFGFAALDTDPDALGTTPRNTLNFHLEIEDDFIDEDRANYPYLTGRMDLEGKGARRQRPVGRYKLDNRSEFTSTFEDLWQEIVTHHNQHAADLGTNQASFDIFLIHSMGGGTGSGTFPLLLSMLNRIAEESLRSDYVYMAAMGVVPKIPMSEGKDEPTPLPGSPIYYPNAHASLHDVEQLELLEVINQNADQVPSDVVETNQEQELPVHSTGQLTTGQRTNVSEFDFDSPPFDDYWIVGVNEGAMQGGGGTIGPESQRQSINQTMARALYGMTQFSTGAENWTQGKSVLGTVDQAEISVAHDEVRAYAELNNEKEEIERRQDEIPGEIEEHEAEIERLKTRKSNLNLADIDDQELESEIRTKVEVDGFESGASIIEDKSSSDIANFLDTIAEDYDIDGQIVAVDLLRDKLNQTEGGAPEIENEHEDVVQNLWSKHNLQSLPGNSGIRTIPGKAEATKEYLEDQISEYRQVKEEWDPGFWEKVQDWIPPALDLGTGLFESERENAEAWLAALQSDYDELEQIMGTWGRVENMKAVISDRRSDIRGQITDKIHSEEGEIDDLHDEKNELEAELKSIERNIDAKVEELTTARTSMRLADLPIVQSKLEKVDLDLVENHLNSLADYVDRDLINENAVRNALSQRVNYAASWENDVIDGNISNTDIPLYQQDWDEFWKLYHPANRELMEMIDRSTDADEEKTPEGEIEYLNDPYRIEYVTYTRRGPVSRLNIYQAMDRMRENGQLAKLGAQYEDHLQSFAYVEWYKDDREIQNAFDAELQVTVARPPEMDISRVHKPDLSEGELKNAINSNGLDSYFWHGVMWEDYDPVGDFTGWRDKLRTEGVGWNELQKSTPDEELKARWHAGAADWDDIIDAYRQNLIEHTGIEIEFEDD